MFQIRTFAFVVALLAATAPAMAQDEASSAPAATPKILINAGCSIGSVYSVASDQHGNVAVAGYCGNLNAAYRTFVTKADSEGVVQWTYRPAASTRPTNVALDGSGNVLVLGQTRVGTAIVGTVLKIDSTGVPAWSRTVEPAQPGNISCASLAVDADDSVYASCSGSPAPSGAIVAYYSDGTAIWRTNASEATPALFAANGKLYGASATNARVIDRASGVVLSDVHVSDSGSVRVGQDGKIYVKSRDAGQAGGAITVYDEALNPIGSIALNATLGAARSYDYFDVDARGNVYVLGAYYSTAELTGGGQYVAEFGPGGDALWQSAVAESSALFSPRQSPSALNGGIGASVVSVSHTRCYVSTYLYLLEFPVR